MAKNLKKEFGIEATLSGGAIGIFDVRLDGQLIFSKFDEGRHAYKGEIEDSIRKFLT